MTWNDKIRRYGSSSVHLLEKVGLITIAVATVVAFGQELHKMLVTGEVTLGDLLLMFIYIEVFSMVNYYLSSGKLPVRYPLYIGMVALGRYLVLDVKEMSSYQMLAVAGAILLLAIAVLVVRYGHVRFPYKDKLPDLEQDAAEKSFQKG